MSAATDGGVSASTCQTISGLGSAQYIVYAVLGTGVVASEALGLTKYVKPNTIVEVVVWFGKTCLVPFMKKREEKAAADGGAAKSAEAVSATSPVAAVSGVV
jgi:hypothetical protein